MESLISVEADESWYGEAKIPCISAAGDPWVVPDCCRDEKQSSLPEVEHGRAVGKSESSSDSKVDEVCDGSLTECEAVLGDCPSRSPRSWRGEA